MKTIFEKIIEGLIPSEKVFENDKVIVIKDIAPKAAIHLLLITKKVIPSIQLLQPEDYPLLNEIFKTAKELATKLGVDKTGYRLVVNHGDYAGQTIPHLHFHFLAGEPLGEMG